MTSPTFPQRLAKAAIAYHEGGPHSINPDVRIIGRESTGHYTLDPERGGYWVQAEVYVPAYEIDPEPGPTYYVWITNRGWVEQGTSSPWNWNYHTHVTLEDDPDGIGARHGAHEHADRLRKTYPCAFVAVRPADKGLPLPVRCE